MSLAILGKVVSAGVIGQLQSWDPKDRKWQILRGKKSSRREIHCKKIRRKWHTLVISNSISKPLVFGVLQYHLKNCSLLCEVPLRASINRLLFFHRFQVAPITFTKLLCLVICCQVFLQVALELPPLLNIRVAAPVSLFLRFPHGPHLAFF